MTTNSIPADTENTLREIYSCYYIYPRQTTYEIGQHLEREKTYNQCVTDKRFDDLRMRLCRTGVICTVLTFALLICGELVARHFHQQFSALLLLVPSVAAVVLFMGWGLVNAVHVVKCSSLRSRVDWKSVREFHALCASMYAVYGEGEDLTYPGYCGRKELSGYLISDAKTLARRSANSSCQTAEDLIVDPSGKTRARFKRLVDLMARFGFMGTDSIRYLEKHVVVHGEDALTPLEYRICAEEREEVVSARAAQIYANIFQST